MKTTHEDTMRREFEREADNVGMPANLRSAALMGFRLCWFMVDRWHNERIEKQAETIR